MHLTVDVGGRPGLDCRGFCEFCYFKGLKRVEASGCRRCKPYKKGCDYCAREVVEIEPGYKPLEQLLFEVSQKSALAAPDMIIIKGNGDVSCYPNLPRLVEEVSGGGLPVFLDYTSGKGFTGEDDADLLADAGVSRVSFSIFSTNPRLRRQYVNDRNPEIVLKNFRTLCERCEVYAMIVLIPGINDGQELERTCREIEDMGARGLMLMSFANSREQGLIFGNEPIMPGIKPYDVQDIRRISTDISERYSMRVIGTPLWDPLTKAPFALYHHRETLKRLPAIERSATIITSSIAYPFLSSIFEDLGGQVNVVAVKKEIGSLITIEDFRSLCLDNIKDIAIIPGNVLAHNRDILRALGRDGKRRLAFRGPDELTVVSERSIYMTAQEVLDTEIEAFSGLIEMINDLGAQTPDVRAARNQMQKDRSSRQANPQSSAWQDKVVSVAT